MRVRIEVMIWLSVCCMVCWMLSMSFVTRLRMSPRGVAVEVLERQPGELLVDVLSQPIDDPRHHPGHEVALQPREEGAQQVDGRHDEQDPADGGEIDALAGDDVGHAGEHVRQVRPDRPRAAPATACSWVTPAGQLLARRRRRR